MIILGLDIGGANIKAATADGSSVSVPFAIWKDRGGLTRRLMDVRSLLDVQPQLVALTMTAELADCYATKAEGVADVIRQTNEAFPEATLRVWLTSGEFAEPDDAIELWSLVAAANWHALATWAARAVPKGPALLIDVGSTTTDVIPLLDGLPASEGTTDAGRLAASELLYTGVRRTPICAMVRTIPVPSDWSGPQSSSGMIPVAAELFATALDVHLVTGDISDNVQDTDTADGRPATRAAAMSRIARMVCCDRDELSGDQIESIAQYIAEQQLAEITAAIRNRAACIVAQNDGERTTTIPVILSGSGAWLAEKAINVVSEFRFDPVSNLSNMFVKNVSSASTAFAIARLAAERCQHDLLPLSSL